MNVDEIEEENDVEDDMEFNLPIAFDNGCDAQYDARARDVHFSDGQVRA